MRENGFRYNTLAPGEKIICGLCYLSFLWWPLGMIGVIWLIVLHFMRIQPKDFVKFHVFQALFISILLYIFRSAMSIILGILGFIPFLGDLIMNIVYYISAYPVILGYFSILSFVLIVGLIYLAVGAFMGKYSRIPWVSDNVRRIAGV